MTTHLIIGSRSDDPQFMQEALRVLEQTSRTFFVPISRLPNRLQQAVGSAYLCLRAIDEIEDHATLTGEVKQRLLRSVSRSIQSSDSRLWDDALLLGADEYKSELAEVTRRLPEWLALAPRSIAHRIWDTIATMADRMVEWVSERFRISSEADLDRYTMCVAGVVGLMLSDLWAWFDGTQTDRGLAVSFRRGLQAVNILRNRQDDLGRGVNFFPPGWDEAQMSAYARRNLSLGDKYLGSLPPGAVYEFCQIPLLLAHATLEALAQGRSKLSREDVERLLGQVGG